jgi:aminopeptidase N
MHKLFTALRSLLLVLFLFNSIAIPAQQPAAQQTAPPVQYPRSHNYDVQHYRIEATFDWQEKSISGTTTITFKPFTNDVKEVEVDAGNMTIKTVTLDNGAPLTFRYVNNEKLYVTLDKTYTTNSVVAVRIAYKAIPKDGQGLTFITPTETEKTRPYQIWSQGEARTNHYWFPCYDAPNDKATSELIATVEDRFQVISNGVLISETANRANKTKTYHWKMDQPFSSYLISLVVGEYAEVRDRFKTVPVSSFVYKNQQADAHVSLGKLPQMVAFFSERLGYDFPYKKYAQIMVRDFPGAMENITATTMTDTAVHDARAHLDVSSDSIVAHELAHSWFGDLLTCREWAEIWLNESFATFMEAAWTEHDKGKDEYLYEMYNNQQAYFQAWNSGTRRPIVTKLYSDPDALFDTYAYPRGGAVVNMIRYVLGDEAFWKAMNTYLKKYAYQNVETQQLVATIEEATGQNLQWFIDEWVYKMGHPEFDITSSYDDSAKKVTLNVKQTQKPDEERKWYPSVDVFTMPVDIAITTAAGEKVHRVLIDQKEEIFTFPADSKPLIINFDRGNFIIKKVNFNRSDEELAYQALHDTDVMGRIRAVVELKGRINDATTTTLGEVMLRDAFAPARVEAAKALLGRKDEAAKEALLTALNDKDSKVRRAAVQSLATMKDQTLADRYIELIHKDPSYFVVADAATALGQSGSPKAFPALLESLKMDSWNDTIRGGAMGGLGYLKDPRSYDIALKYAAPGNSPALRAAAMSLLVATGKGKEGVLEILVAGLKDPSFDIKAGALQAMMALGDVRAIPALEELAKQPGLPPFALQFINGAINQIRNANKPGEK